MGLYEATLWGCERVGGHEGCSTVGKMNLATMSPPVRCKYLLHYKKREHLLYSQPIFSQGCRSKFLFSSTPLYETYGVVAAAENSLSPEQAWT